MKGKREQGDAPGKRHAATACVAAFGPGTVFPSWRRPHPAILPIPCVWLAPTVLFCFLYFSKTLGSRVHLPRPTLSAQSPCQHPLSRSACPRPRAPCFLSPSLVATTAKLTSSSSPSSPPPPKENHACPHFPRRARHCRCVCQAHPPLRGVPHPCRCPPVSAARVPVPLLAPTCRVMECMQSRTLRCARVFACMVNRACVPTPALRAT